MDYVYAVVLGVVQGVSEFLPISSDGHLVLVEELLRANSSTPLPAWLKGITMTIALHFGTLLSIIVVYFRDLLALLKQPWMLLLIVVASIPVACVGLLFKDDIEALFDSPIAAGWGLLGTAALLLAAKRLQSGHRELKSMPVWTAGVIGAFQVIALLPGVSRSGSTIASGLTCGLNRPDAARFSFLIAVPAIGGACLLELKDIVTGESPIDASWQPMLLGAVISFCVGLFCLRWLIKLLSQDRLHWFAYYCLCVGLLTIAWQSGLFSTATPA